MCPKKILVVDDEPDILELLAKNLSRYGYEVLKAGNGKEGLDLANRMNPDIIISDLIMPEMDGLELCWMIRQTSNVPLVPFILLTVKDDPEVRINSFRSGADAYLQKPVSMRELTTRVENLLQRVEKLKGLNPRPHRSFAGDLADFSLVELMQLLNMNKKSGTLWLSRDNERGNIYFSGGDIVSARLGNSEGEKAIHEMAHWRRGYFDFESGEATSKKTITIPTMKIILDCCDITEEKQTPGINS